MLKEAPIFVSSVLTSTATDLCKSEGHDIIMQIKKCGKNLSHMHKVVIKLSDGTHRYDYERCNSGGLAIFSNFTCTRCDWNKSEIACFREDN